MAMPRKVRCRWCNRHTDVAGELSARKVCADCGAARVTAAITQIRDRRGPMFDRYRAGLTDYVANLYRGEISSTLDTAGDAIESVKCDAPARMLSSR